MRHHLIIKRVRLLTSFVLVRSEDQTSGHHQVTKCVRLLIQLYPVDLEDQTNGHR